MHQSSHQRHVSEEAVTLMPALQAFGRSLTRDLDDADDLVQDTLVKAIDRAHLFAAGTNLRAWLFTIMRNTHKTNWVKRRREAPGKADCVSGDVISQPTQEWSLRWREVMEAVDTLPVHYREALVIVLIRGESYDDSARMCDCAIGTIKSRVARARTMVAERLEQDGPEPMRASC